MRYRKGRVDIITMGCSKNLIDSERLMRRLEAKGYSMHHDSANVCGEYVMVNTCGFIGDAKEESIEMILSLAEMKARGEIGHLAVMGCLSQRYPDELKTELPEVDRWYGKFDWNGYADQLPDLTAPQTSVKPWERSLTTPDYSAYLKISEGCNRFCAFCAIPLITGRHTSRPADEILAEVEELTGKGVREFNVIAQDLSSYGLDIYGRHALAELIDRMAGIEGVEWIRLHYAYPSDFPDDVLDVMARHDNVCKYLDIALQHISDGVLSRMRRNIDGKATLALIEKLRRKVPGIKLRTTLMVGFPGETDAEFAELLDFVRHARFDRMGAFAYSEEDDTFAAINYEDDVPADVKQKRLDIIMETQRDISESVNRSMIGCRVKVLVDSVHKESITGRTQWDSPEVDPEIIVSGFNGNMPAPGDFIEADVTGADYYELTGTVAK